MSGEFIVHDIINVHDVINCRQEQCERCHSKWKMIVNFDNVSITEKYIDKYTDDRNKEKLSIRFIESCRSGNITVIKKLCKKLYKNRKLIAYALIISLSLCHNDICMYLSNKYKCFLFSKKFYVIDMIIMCIKYNNLDFFEYITTNCGVDVDKYIYSSKILYAICRFSSIGFINFLLEKYDIKFYDIVRFNPLSLKILFSNSSIEFMEQIFDSGLTIYHVEYYQYPILQSLCKENQLSVIRYLFNKELNIIPLITETSIIEDICYNGVYSTLKLFADHIIKLRDLRFFIDTANHYRYIYHASFSGSMPIVNYLYNIGCRLSLDSLYIALYKSRYDIVDFHIEHDMAINMLTERQKRSIFLIAIFDDKKLLKYIMDTNGTSMNGVA